MDHVPHGTLNALRGLESTWGDEAQQRSTQRRKQASFDGSSLRRLRRMSLTEIAYRGRQEATKWIERVSSRVEEEPAALLRAQTRALADPDAASGAIRQAVPRRFFAGVADEGTAPALWAHLADECRATLAAADTLLEHRFNLLGYQMLWFGDPIDWHLDPVLSRRTPLLHWSLLDPLDSSVVGDSKVVWELNRHQWLVRLAQAWALTGDERYAVACVDAIDSWLDANPPGIGINWASSLEVSYRLMSWCWTVLLIRESNAISQQWTLKLLAAIWRHANHISRYLSYYFSPNTHLTGEALGLIYAGTLFPEFYDAQRWRTLGAQILIAESRVQLSSDGVYFEQSTCYQRYTTDTYMQFLMLAARNGISVPGDVLERTEKMVDFLLSIRQPDGSIPAIGDVDGGALFPLVQRAPGDARATFALAASLFRRSDFAWAAGAATPEALWSLGPRALDGFTPANAPPAGQPSRLFSSGGYAIMRTSWEPDAHQMIVDVGPLGCPITSGHGHADLLGIQCAVFGEPFLVDAGTYCYTGESHWRDFFRSTAAHSTLLIDGESQAQPAGPFRWDQRPHARLRAWRSGDQYDFLDADHDAYLRLADPVTCRRRVIFFKPDFWLVVDDLGGARTHTVELTYQFAPLRLTLMPDSWARAMSSKGHALWVATFARDPLHASIARGALDPMRGWISYDYGQRQPAPALVFSSITALPSRAMTLLVPERSVSSSPPKIQPLYDDSGTPVGVTCADLSRSIQFDDNSVLITPL